MKKLSVEQYHGIIKDTKNHPLAEGCAVIGEWEGHIVFEGMMGGGAVISRSYLQQVLAEPVTAPDPPAPNFEEIGKKVWQVALNATHNAHETPPVFNTSIGPVKVTVSLG